MIAILHREHLGGSGNSFTASSRSCAMASPALTGPICRLTQEDVNRLRPDF
jgi:hypothetical protein